jgi:hypothetical protein
MNLEDQRGEPTSNEACLLRASAAQRHPVTLHGVVFDIFWDADHQPPLPAQAGMK